MHVVFVVDCSGSMAGERIGSLNWAARAAVPAMREAAAEHPGVNVVVRVIRFSDGVDWPVLTPTPVADFVWTNLAAGGETAMGAALTALASAFSAEEGSAAGQLPPAVVLLSDGYPTDDAEAGLAALAGTALGRDATRIAIAIGQDADLDLLRTFMGDPAAKPLRAGNAEMLASRLRWAASAPIRTGGAHPEAVGHDDREDLVW